MLSGSSTMSQAPRRISAWIMFIAMFSLFSIAPAWAVDNTTPRLYLGYVFTTHHTPLMAAVDQGEAFKASGGWLKPMDGAIQF